MIWIVAVISGFLILAHTAPFRFVLDVQPPSIWRMPETDPPTVYLTIDDGPNPTATPELLDVLAKAPGDGDVLHHRQAPDRRDRTIVRRAFEEGHAVALHSHTRTLMFKTPDGFADTPAAPPRGWSS